MWSRGEPAVEWGRDQRGPRSFSRRGRVFRTEAGWCINSKNPAAVVVEPLVSAVLSSRLNRVLGNNNSFNFCLYCIAKGHSAWLFACVRTAVVGRGCSCLLRLGVAVFVLGAEGEWVRGLRASNGSVATVGRVCALFPLLVFVLRVRAGRRPCAGLCLAVCDSARGGGRVTTRVGSYTLERAWAIAQLRVDTPQPY